jgi:hypothetical protein
VRNYENEPPLETWSITGKIGVIQVCNRKAGRKLLEFLDDRFDHFILWARDHDTYRAIVDNIEAHSDARLQ